MLSHTFSVMTTDEGLQPVTIMLANGKIYVSCLAKLFNEVFGGYATSFNYDCNPFESLNGLLFESISDKIHKVKDPSSQIKLTPII